VLIATGALSPNALAGRVAIVTGAGSGIGFEAARALAWLGARVAIAEIDGASGAAAANRLVAEFPQSRCLFVQTDVAEEASVAHLIHVVEAERGPIEIVLNNATIASVGQLVADTSIVDWDRSYGVNLRGPVLLAQACLPSMIRLGRGVFVCVSSTGGPYLGTYETLKAAQVALANTLDAELIDTGVIAFTIGPGLVPTATAAAAVEVIAPKMGLSLEAFYEMNRGALMSVEAAGAGFAAAIAMAERYAGQEISSSQALVDVGIVVPDVPAVPAGVTLPTPATPETAMRTGGHGHARELAEAVRTTLVGQAEEWRGRSFFERQWMLRDFKQRAGMPVERWVEALDRFIGELGSAGPSAGAVDAPPLAKLSTFYGHMADLARGYVKDPSTREEQVAIVTGWRSEVDALIAALREPG
jgi:NAD(P)-dependent dehydrogenase (short-subunit alcohol dehydrogenase family)